MEASHSRTLSREASGVGDGLAGGVGDGLAAVLAEKTTKEGIWGAETRSTFAVSRGRR